MTEDSWHSQETYKSLITYGNGAVRFVILVNGGAIISLLTFLGNFLKSNQAAVDMFWPLFFYLSGIILGGFSYITAYFTQFTLYNESNENIPVKCHMIFLYLSLFLIVFGIIAFGVGSLLALLEIREYEV